MSDRPMARVTLSFDYPIDLAYYPSDEVLDAVEAAAFDQKQFEESPEDVRDLLGWADTPVSISIEAVSE